MILQQTEIDAVKTASKRAVKKNSRSNRILIKIADKITSASKTKSKEKEKENQTNEIKEIFIPAEKRQQIIDKLRLL